MQFLNIIAIESNLVFGPFLVELFYDDPRERFDGLGRRNRAPVYRRWFWQDFHIPIRFSQVSKNVPDEIGQRKTITDGMVAADDQL